MFVCSRSFYLSLNEKVFLFQCKQGRSQTSEQDEASLERRRRGQLEGSKGSGPPDNFEF